MAYSDFTLEKAAAVLGITTQEADARLKELAPQQGIELVRFSNDVLTFAKDKTEEFLKIYDNPNTVFNEVYGKWLKFRDQSRAWSDLNSLK